MLGATRDIEDLFHLEFAEGRYFNLIEYETASDVCLLGNVVSEGLFGPGIDPIGKLINYGGNLLIEPTATGTLTVTAHPGWRQGIGDVNYAIRATPITGASVVSNFDFRNGSVFASTGPASVQVTGTGANHAVSVGFSMFCNGGCSGGGTQFTIALP